MAREKSTNGNGSRLEEAMALLIQNQDAFLTRVSETDRQMAESNRQIADAQRQIADSQRQITEINRSTDRRFAHIEEILVEHTRILQTLSDMFREKIGFKVPGQ